MSCLVPPKYLGNSQWPRLDFVLLASLASLAGEGWWPPTSFTGTETEIKTGQEVFMSLSPNRVCLSSLSSWSLLAVPHAPAEQVEANEYPDDPSSSDSHLFCTVSYGLMSDDLCNFLNALCDVLSWVFPLDLYRAARDETLKPKSHSIPPVGNNFHTETEKVYAWGQLNEVLKDPPGYISAVKQTR